MAEKNKSAKFRLTVIVYLTEEAVGEGTIYIAGSHKSLGGWNPGKAVPLKRQKNGSFKFVKTFAQGEYIEFKILKSLDTDFGGVEKGGYGEEVANHRAYMQGDRLVPVVITCFYNGNLQPITGNLTINN